MLYSRCTVHDGQGGRCRQVDVCSLVQSFTFNPDGERVLEHEHRVCHGHRLQMGLPETDVALTPHGTFEIDDRGVKVAGSAVSSRHATTQ